MREFTTLMNKRNQASGELIKKETAHELLLTTEIDSMIQEEYLKAAEHGAKDVALMRDILPTVKTRSNRGKVSYLTSGRYGVVGGYKSEAPIFKNKVNSRDFNIRKVWTLPYAPEELITDADWDIVAWEVEKAGASIEHTINRDAISALIDAFGVKTVQDSSGDVDKVLNAYSEIADGGFYPNITILHPLYYKVLLQSSVVELTSLPGPKIHILYEETAGTLNWDYSASGDVGGIVFDSTKAGVIVIKKDISVENYKHPINDLRGAVVYAKFDITHLDPNAICYIYK